MDIRKYLNENPLIGGAVAGGLVLIAIIFGIWYTMSGGEPAPNTGKPDPSKGFYSEDDGKTFFTDDVAKSTPFKHGAKDAVRAYVFKCGSTTFVGLLGRNTEIGRTTPNAKLKGGDYNAIMAEATTPPTFEIKKPGGAWTPVTMKPGDPWHAMLAPNCPGGGSDIPIPIIPGQQ
jgi:hypothetical protein